MGSRNRAGLLHSRNSFPDARRSSQDGGDVVEHLQPLVEGPSSDQFEIDVRISVVDPLAAAGARDHREDDDPKAIHQTSAQELLDQVDLWIKLNAGGVAPEQAYIRTTKVRTKYARHCHVFLFVYALFPLEFYVWSTQSDTCMWGVGFRSFF